MKAGWFGAAAIALLVGGMAVAQAGEHPASAEAIKAALANPARADQAGDDERRHAAEIVAFTGAGEGSKVIDFLPGRGYWTRILTSVVGPKGHVYAIWPQSGARFAPRAKADLDGRNLGNVTTTVLATDDIKVPAPVDVVLTVQNYHDVLNATGGEEAADALNKSVFAALKPGGVYVVIDHADAPGSGVSGTSARHRIDPAVVKAEVLKAGFTFDGESTVLANPADDHSKPVFDPSLRGHTDQFVFRFRKPRR